VILVNRSDQGDTNGERPDTAVDGGGTVANDLFTQVSTTSVDETRVDRMRRLADSYFVAPLMVAWDDWRTRFGGAILVFYIGLALVGPVLNPEPAPFSHTPWLAPLHDGWFTVTSVSIAGISLPWSNLRQCSERTIRAGRWIR
jgi:hypothetical protein